MHEANLDEGKIPWGFQSTQTFQERANLFLEGVKDHNGYLETPSTVIRTIEEVSDVSPRERTTLQWRH